MKNLAVMLSVRAFTRAYSRVLIDGDDLSVLLCFVSQYSSQLPTTYPSIPIFIIYITNPAPASEADMDCGSVVEAKSFTLHIGEKNVIDALRRTN